MISVSPFRTRYGIFLRYDVMGKHFQQVLYSVNLMGIYEHEMGLDSGRFLHFASEPLQYTVSIPTQENTPIPVMVEPLVNWIAENIESPWSIAAEMLHVHSGTITFSFADEKSAFIFKMVAHQ